MIHVGTSGWQYDSWKGRFYPRELPQPQWLPYFAARFETVEVNNSFYRLPDRKTFERWRDATPSGFCIVVKASRYITHIKRLKDPQEPIATFWERATGLGGKLGPVLFQLPPQFHADIERLRTFLGVLPRQMRAAFEFRDASWDSEEVRAMLDAAGAAWVLADRPGRRVPLHITGGWSYIRFHQGRHTHPAYPRRKLVLWADRIASLAARDVYVYFNNDQLGAAIRDARTMRELLNDRGAHVAPVPAAA